MKKSDILSERFVMPTDFVKDKKSEITKYIAVLMV
jgi:hypothetical protein